MASLVSDEDANLTPSILSVVSCETGTLVFATLNLVTWALGVVGGFGGLIYCAVNGEDSDSDGIMLMTVLSQASFFLLLFGAFLFHGVLKKHSELIKAYLVLGATMLFLSGIALLAMVPTPFILDLPSEAWHYWSPNILAMVVMGQVVYALILAMIYSTYRKIKDANNLNDYFNKFTKMLAAPPKRYSVCSSEKGAVIFAYLNLIGSVLGVLGGVAGMLHCYMMGDYRRTEQLLLCSEISLFIMVFAAFLFHGVVKKHQEHLKVYLVMGSVMLFSSNFGFMMLLPFITFMPITPFRGWSIGILALTVVVQVLYALILAMIYNAYKKIKATPKDQYEQNVVLVENMNENLETSAHKLLH